MSEHEGIDDEKRSELAERMIWLGNQNREAHDKLKAGGRTLNPVEVMHVQLAVMLDLAFGPIPRVTSTEELAERIADARLVFEVEWQQQLAALIERANKPTIAVPNHNGKLHLP